MNLIQTLCLAALATLAATASAGEPPQPAELLSISTVTTGGHTVSLAKTRRTDGTVCQDYISQVSRKLAQPAADESYTVTIGTICDTPYRVESPAGGLGVGEEYPRKLKSMRWVRTAGPLGDGIHILDLAQ